METNDVNYNWHLDRLDGGNRTYICNNSWHGDGVGSYEKK